MNKKQLIVAWDMRVVPLLILTFFLLTTNLSFSKSEINQPASYYNELGIKYGEEGDFDNAIENFHKVIQINPKYTSAYVNLGIIYGKMGKYDMAIENLKKALELNPHLQEAYINLGAIYEKQGVYDKAVEYAQKALLLNRNNAIATYNLGYAYLMKGNKDLALEQYKKLKEMKQDKLADRLQDKIIQKNE